MLSLLWGCPFYTPPTPIHHQKEASWYSEQIHTHTHTHTGRSDPVFPPRQPGTGRQPALLDWTGAGILGAAAQHWPFTVLPFSSARVKRSAGAGETREGGCRRKRGDRKEERDGVVRRGSLQLCEKCTLLFQDKPFFLSSFLCAVA